MYDEYTFQKAVPSVFQFNSNLQMSREPGSNHFCLVFIANRFICNFYMCKNEELIITRMQCINDTDLYVAVVLTVTQFACVVDES